MALLSSNWLSCGCAPCFQRFQALPASISLAGGTPEIAVDVDPARMQALGLTINDVATALNSANSVAAVGRVEDRHRLYLALVENRIANEADIAAVPLKAATDPGAGIVTLGQVATIRRAPAPAWTRVTSNGTNAVLVNIRQTPAADAVTLVKAIDERLKSAGLPTDVIVSPFYDQSELVAGAASAVRDAILLGAFLAGLVLFLFLRSWRLMVITAALLPAVLAATCLALLVLGMSFNMMTLGGMAAGCRPDRRRRCRHARTSHAPDAGGACQYQTIVAGRCGGNGTAVVRIDGCDDRCLSAACIHHRCHWWFLQGPGSDDDGRSDRVAAICPLRFAPRRLALAHDARCRGGREG
jgi:hypothetical protein